MQYECNSDVTSSAQDFCGENPWMILEEEQKVTSINDLIKIAAEIETKLINTKTYEGREIDEAILAGYRVILDERVKAFDAALVASIPDLKDRLNKEIYKKIKNEKQQQVYVEEIFVKGVDKGLPQLRVLSAKIIIRTFNYAIVPTEIVTERVDIIGGVYPSGEEVSAERYWSQMGVVESVPGPVDWVLTAWGVIGGIRFLAGLTFRTIMTRAPRILVRSRWFAKPKVEWDPYLTACYGTTDPYGNIVISKAISEAEQKATLYHEMVHSFLSPKFIPFRDVRAKIGANAYAKSQLLRYTEEALAETYAQLRANGLNLNSIVKGFEFPMLEGGKFYRLTWSGIIKEGAIGVTLVGTISIGGSKVTSYFISKP